MNKLDKIGTGNVPPSPKQTKPIVAEDLNKVIDKANELIDDLVEFNSQTGTAYTLTLSDANKYIKLDNANAITLTIPLDSTVAFPIGTVVTVEQTGAGAVTATAEVGVTINGNVLSASQFSILVLIKTATNAWTCVGGTV